MALVNALVFGEVDPKAYWAPLCGCGHVEDEHYDPDGGPPSDEPGQMAPCWADWTGTDEGCECLVWKPKT
jgi:hypothetical protein